MEAAGLASAQASYTVPAALVALFNVSVQDFEIMMVGAVITAVPDIVLILALQRF